MQNLTLAPRHPAGRNHNFRRHPPRLLQRNGKNDQEMICDIKFKYCRIFRHRPAWGDILTYEGILFFQFFTEPMAPALEFLYLKKLSVNIMYRFPYTETIL